MSPSRPPTAVQMPSLSMRVKSSMIMGLTGLISRCFLHGFNRVEAHGLAQFRELLDSRADPEKRERGLLTVSNHVSVLDDPMVWGLLPLSYAFNPNNLRWTLGAHDICFKNPVFASFFTHGQVLPCHRSKHSIYGGLFQPCMTQAIRLLSNPAPAPSETHYSTTGTDSILSPLTHPYYRRYSWVHVFPEGLVHQHPDVDLRYFKWGIARLILESEPKPDIVPMFIDGTQKCMAEDRGFPKFLPRIGKTISVTFGPVLSYEETFGDLKSKWDDLVRRENARQQKTKTVGWLWKTPVVVEQAEEVQPVETQVGELMSEELRCGKEATEIRIEVARRMREEILRLRRERGLYGESDVSFGLAETWKVDKKEGGKKYTSNVDGSRINQD
ncbi:putative lysophosphatidylcholine acyltransferase [Triangularia verruculosa]|uniref:Tafazzin family protein n=1 Tax=Triangularia verruculosa TaxID=2587418 RepID=A0AAN7AYN4_9PEZI|nr:putative lysophosphatidylcholine acyltransferase [Triangularia verruculosa]